MLVLRQDTGPKYSIVRPHPDQPGGQSNEAMDQRNLRCNFNKHHVLHQAHFHGRISRDLWNISKSKLRDTSLTDDSNRIAGRVLLVFVSAHLDRMADW